MSIGSRIKQRREELGLTQPELAKLVGISKGSIGNYESNVSSPNEKILFKLFEILKCDANFLYQDDFQYNLTNENVAQDSKEIKLLTYYRQLDVYGKDMVDTVLDIEYKRCAEHQKSTRKFTIAARDGNTKAGTEIEINESEYKLIQSFDSEDKNM